MTTIRKVSIFLLILLSLSAIPINAQTIQHDLFLGTWVLEDGYNKIGIIKEGNVYYIIEFVRIKHELFFSGDGNRALFQEWGKGPPGICGLELRDNNTILYYGVSENADWALSYIFYKKP